MGRKSELYLLFAGLLACSPFAAQSETSVPAGPPDVAPAVLQSDSSVSLSVFFSALAPYGHWVLRADVGWLWVPALADPDWRPYTLGHWELTPAGATWASEEPFGWATYHYGRWSEDPEYGWVWLPDDEWGPAWVTWRSGDGYVGWAPLPPDVPDADDLTADDEPAPDAYCFVPESAMLEPSVVVVLVPVVRNVVIIRQTTNVFVQISAGPGAAPVIRGAQGATGTVLPPIALKPIFVPRPDKPTRRPLPIRRPIVIQKTSVAGLSIPLVGSGTGSPKASALAWLAPLPDGATAPLHPAPTTLATAAVSSAPREARQPAESVQVQRREEVRLAGEERAEQQRKAQQVSAEYQREEEARAELQKQREREQQAEQQRAADQQRQSELQRAAEQQRLAAEQQRQAADQQRQAAEQQQRQADQQRQAAEQQRQGEAERQAEAQRQAEQARQQAAQAEDQKRNQNPPPPAH